MVAVAASRRHEFSKQPATSITLVEGIGVVGDCHAGVTVQHLSRVRRDPTRPNLRQVHLIAAELLEQLASAGYDVHAGDLGENVTTSGVDLLALPTGTRLAFDGGAVVEVTGLRNPCLQIDRFRSGLLAEVVGRDADGEIVRRAGVMGVVVVGGPIRTGESLRVALPAGPHEPLRPV